MLLDDVVLLVVPNAVVLVAAEPDVAVPEVFDEVPPDVLVDPPVVAVEVADVVVEVALVDVDVADVDELLPVDPVAEELVVAEPVVAPDELVDTELFELDDVLDAVVIGGELDASDHAYNAIGKSPIASVEPLSFTITVVVNGPPPSASGWRYDIRLNVMEGGAISTVDVDTASATASPRHSTWPTM